MRSLQAVISMILKVLLGLRVSPTYQSNVGATIFSGTWTAPADGIVVLVATFNTSGSGAYWYVQDSSDIIGAMCLNSANGYRQSTVIPVYKGGTYKTYASSSLTTATGWFYKTNCILGGGYCVNAVFSVLSPFIERRWEHERTRRSEAYSGINQGQEYGTRRLDSNYECADRDRHERYERNASSWNLPSDRALRVWRWVSPKLRILHIVRLGGSNSQGIRNAGRWRVALTYRNTDLTDNVLFSSVSSVREHSNSNDEIFQSNQNIANAALQLLPCRKAVVVC